MDRPERTRAAVAELDWKMQGVSTVVVATLPDEVGDDEMRTGELHIRPILAADAGEVLTLQRAAFVQEAMIYGDPRMPALTQTLEELEAELIDNLGYVAQRGERVVGAIRAVASARRLLIGRIAIAPDQQGEGIGRTLIQAVEDRGRSIGCRDAELFTGSHSDANRRLYEELGYREADRVDQGDGTAQIFLRKSLGTGPSDED